MKIKIRISYFATLLICLPFAKQMGKLCLFAYPLRSKWASSAYLLIGLLVYLFSVAPSFAQGQSLSIYPPVIEVQTTPPSSPSVPIVIHNNNSDDVVLKIELIPFKTNGISGEVVLMPEEINKGFYPYYRDKIQFLLEAKKTDTISLEALESKEIDLNINLTEGDPPGDYYYSIVFISEANGPSETSVSQIPAGIATNLLLSIGPKDEASGGTSQFKTSSLKSSGPVDFILKLHNASKHLINPTGSIEITNLFGQNVGNVKILPQYILARSDRFLVDDAQVELDTNPKVIWPEKFIFGWYKATANIQLEENGSKIKAVTYFFAFPLYFFFPLVIIIFVSLSVYLRVKKKI
jgi:hypothetical protein